MVGRPWLVPLLLCYSEQDPPPLWSSESGETDPKELSQPAASCEAPSGPLGMLSWKKARPPNPSRCADRCRSHGVLISFLSHTAVQFLRGSTGKKHLRSD